MTVTVTFLYGAPTTYAATSAADGSVTFAALPVGDYALKVVHWTQYYGDANEQVMGGSDNSCDVALLPGSHTTPPRNPPPWYSHAPLPTVFPRRPPH